ncbi:MAG: hypothetical protein DRH89_00600 [Candidatus Cloacimonadota bacterium]|nr:MAG: hypothetical protein DRH89_00600 [Candidatus Cloacimonadota bacterium]
MKSNSANLFMNLKPPFIPPYEGGRFVILAKAGILRLTHNYYHRFPIYVGNDNYNLVSERNSAIRVKYLISDSA